MNVPNQKPPYLGFGLGLRPQHYAEILDAVVAPAIDWFEVISENFMIDGGRPLKMLDRIRERYPVVMLWPEADFDWDYLAKLKALADRMVMSVDDMGVVVLMAGNVKLHDPVSGDAIEEILGSEAVIKSAHIDIIDVEQEPAAGALGEFGDKLPFRHFRLAVRHIGRDVFERARLPPPFLTGFQRRCGGPARVPTSARQAAGYGHRARSWSTPDRSA